MITLQDLIYEAELAGLSPSEIIIRYAATDGSDGTAGGYYDALNCSIYAGATIPKEENPEELETVNILFLD